MENVVEIPWLSIDNARGGLGVGGAVTAVLAGEGCSTPLLAP